MSTQSSKWAVIGAYAFGGVLLQGAGCIGGGKKSNTRPREPQIPPGTLGAAGTADSSTWGDADSSRKETITEAAKEAAENAVKAQAAKEATAKAPRSHKVIG